MSSIRLFSYLLGLLKPVYIGFALAFVLNRPCQALYRLYHRGLGRTRADRLSRPLAVASSYVLLIAVVTVITSFITPKVVESIQIFAHKSSGYLYNLQKMSGRALPISASGEYGTELTQHSRAHHIPARDPG